MRSVLRRVTAAVLALVLALTLSDQPALAAEPDWEPLAPPEVAGVAVSEIAPRGRPAFGAAAAVVTGDRQVEWPAPAIERVALPSDSRDRAGSARPDGAPEPGLGGRVSAGELPVRVGAAPRTASPARMPEQVSVRVSSHEVAQGLGIEGLLVSVARADGQAADASVTVEIDYSRFRHAYGGDWSARLRVAMLGRCGLHPAWGTAGVSGACGTVTPLATANDHRAGLLAAEVPVSGDGGSTMLAVSAGPSGDNGDYTATKLSPASTWQVSAQTGGFTWSYPLRMVPGVGGPEPNLSLSYSSQSMDGQTANTNTQGSWVGDGWDIWPGYVERRYQSCSEDEDAVGGEEPNNLDDAVDQCWFNDNATMSLNGQSVELVSNGDGTYTPTSDDGSRVQRLTNTGFGNGDNDGEYWKVTTVDGTQYFFGRHRRPEYPDDGAQTNSTWTAPVYGNHPGEPCHASAFADSRCNQAWRWNLDYVVDPHGNTITYFYTRETGAYGRELDPDKRTTYHRGGYLKRIEYGTRKGTEHEQPVPARVIFELADRCLPGSGCDKDEPEDWPDTPWDQFCESAPCTDQLVPTFWTGKRLAKIRAQVWRGSGHQDVESWTLRYDYLDAGAADGEGIPMWLSGLTRTGHVTAAGGSSVSDPEITFDPGSTPLSNRVDGPADGKTKLNRWRVKDIATESGALVGIVYSSPECTRQSLPQPHQNTKRCYPQWYSITEEDPTLDWFHKYVVDLLIVEDLTGASPRMETHYDYLDDPAWHYDDSELVDKDKRTWSQWRGYSRVRVRKGLEQETQSVTEYLYMRGMNGDRASPSGGTKSVQITDSQGTSVTDHEAHTGFLREETTINGLGGEWVSGTINTPWRHGPTATSGPLKAWLTNTSTVRARTNLAAGGVRWTRTTTSFDTTYGMPTQVDDRGDEAITADDRCVRHEYARNPSIWMVDKVRRTETVGVRCSQTPQRPGDVLSDERTFYDDPDTFGAPPTRGLAVKQQEVDSWTGGTPVWLTTERSTFDARGRVLSVSDALNQTTSTSYVPAASGPLTRTIETNPAGHTETMTLEPAWGLPTGVVDANGHVADLTYDGAGRLTAVWLPGRDNQTQSASLRFAYELRADAPTAVTSKKLLPDGVNYITSVILYDGNLRERQTQTQTHGGGRLLEDTVYDSRGLVEMKAEPYYDPSNEPPSTTLVGPAGTVEIPGLTRKVYDGAERVLHEIFMDRGQEAWRSSFGYGGDRVHMTPPAGGTATTTIKDARDRTVALRQYHGPTPSGAYDETTYAYSRRDELASVTDPVGNTWTYAYDQRGRQVTAADPDTGTTTMTYDAIGQDLTVTDGRGETVGYTYDALGRVTSVRSGSPAGAKLAEWVFDTLPDGVGKLTRSVRYHDGEAYTKEILGYNEQGEPTGTRVTIPAAEVGLAGSYESLTTYQPDGSSVATTTLPAAGDLGAEELAVGYDDAGAATWLVSALSVYVGTVSYSTLGDLTGRELGTFGRRTGISYTYDDATRRLMATSAMVETGSGPVEVLDLSYRYDAAENLVRIADAPGSTSTPNDTQCYRYDHLQRLTDAWTPASTADTNCDTYPGPLGGQAPYRLVWTYDQTGNRLSQTRYGLGGGTTTYDHPAPGAPHPHAVSGAVTSGPGGSGVASYEYDDAGNLVERDRDGEVQTLSWDAEGRVATVQDSGGQTEFIYDADGNRLIRRDPDGKTLYLPSTELRYDNATGQRTCTRYYEHLGTTVAVRTAEGLYWLVNDHHQTGEVAVRDSDGQTVRRRTTPFGQPRGQAPAWWPGDKGFVGGTEDPTGLIHLGARLYDSALGRFISVDPIIDEQKPQQMHGYAYSNNAPPTFTDPDGEFLGKLREKVANAAGGAARAVGNAARSAGRATHNFLKDNYKVLDTVSTVLGVAAIACTAIPPLQVAAPFLGAASIAVGAAATYGACASGDAASCGLGLVGMIPGGKAVALGARAARTGIKAARMGVKKGNKNRVFNRWYNVKDNPKVSPRVRSRARNQVASLNLSQVSWSEYHYYSAKISMKQTFRAQQVFNPRRFLDRLDILHKNVSLLNSISRDSAPGSYYPGSAGGGYSPPRGGGGSSGTSRPSTRPSRGGGGGGTNYFF